MCLRIKFIINHSAKIVDFLYFQYEKKKFISNGRVFLQKKGLYLFFYCGYSYLKCQQAG